MVCVFNEIQKSTFLSTLYKIFATDYNMSKTIYFRIIQYCWLPVNNIFVPVINDQGKRKMQSNKELILALCIPDRRRPSSRVYSIPDDKHWYLFTSTVPALMTFSRPNETLLKMA
jgi:hypothetical protein